MVATADGSSVYGNIWLVDQATDHPLLFLSIFHSREDILDSIPLAMGCSPHLAVLFLAVTTLSCQLFWMNGAADRIFRWLVPQPGSVLICSIFAVKRRCI